MPYTFTAAEIEAEIEAMDSGLLKQIGSRTITKDLVQRDRERLLAHQVAELRLRVTRLEEWIGNL